MTWQELIDTNTGTVLQHGEHAGIEYYIVRGPVSVVAYIRIPEESAYLQGGYDEYDLGVHGGLTYKGTKWWEGEPKGSTGSLYFGWDYAQYGDNSFYNSQPGGIQWTDDMVLPEVLEACEIFASRLELEKVDQSDE